MHSSDCFRYPPSRLCSCVLRRFYTLVSSRSTRTLPSILGDTFCFPLVEAGWNELVLVSHCCNRRNYFSLVSCGITRHRRNCPSRAFRPWLERKNQHFGMDETASNFGRRFVLYRFLDVCSHSTTRHPVGRVLCYCVTYSGFHRCCSNCFETSRTKNGSALRQRCCGCLGTSRSNSDSHHGLVRENNH